jgi:hypothetical protein
MITIIAILCSRDTLVNALSFCSKNSEAFNYPRVVINNVYPVCKAVSNFISITDIVGDPEDLLALVGKLARSAFQKYVLEPIENMQNFITIQNEYNNLEHELPSLGSDSMYGSDQENN